MAKLSVVTASYNYQDYIKETIESVINQTFTDWEMIIVDDGSSDNSVEVIKSYCEKDSRIKFYQHKNGINKGLPETVQLGVKKSSADYIIFLESDDTIVPNYMEEKLKIINRYPDIKLIFNDVNMFGDKKIIEWYQKKYFNKTSIMLKEHSYPAKIPELFKELNVIPTFSVVMLNKNVLKGINWNSPLKQSLDHFLWSQIVANNEIYYLNKKLTNWRMSPKSYINRGNVQTENTLLQTLNIRKNLNGGFLTLNDCQDIIRFYEMHEKKHIKYRKLFNISVIILFFVFIFLFLKYILLKAI